MYAYIKGELTDIETDSIVVEAGGVGYRLFVSGLTLDYLPSLGEQIKVYTYLHVREEAFVLYGFLDKDDLRMFELLISVSGIGPKGALGIQSTLSSDDLRFAVLSSDSKAISKAPGIGAKTAQRVIIDLKDKLSLEDAFEAKSSHMEKTNPNAASSAKNEAVMALTALGYSSSESLKAVSKLEIKEDTSVEEILKMALKQMSFL